MEENKQHSEKVRSYRCLYDKTKKSYKDKNICFNAWRVVCSDLAFLETVKSNRSFLYGFMKGHPEQLLFLFKRTQIRAASSSVF